jgi:hypothetical protein
MPLNTKHRLTPSLGINTYISMLMGVVLDGRNRPPPRRRALSAQHPCRNGTPLLRAREEEHLISRVYNRL